MTQRVPDFDRAPNADVFYGLCALLCGALLGYVRWAVGRG